MPSLPVLRSSPGADGNTTRSALISRQLFSGPIERKRSVSGTFGDNVGAGHRGMMNGGRERTRKGTVEAGLPAPIFPVRMRVTRDLPHLEARDSDSDDDGDSEDEKDSDDGDEGDSDEDERNGRKGGNHGKGKPVDPVNSPGGQAIPTPSPDGGPTSPKPLPDDNSSTDSTSSTQATSTPSITSTQTGSSTITSKTQSSVGANPQDSSETRVTQATSTGALPSSVLTATEKSSATDPIDRVTTGTTLIPSVTLAPSAPSPNSGIVGGIIAGVVVLIVILISMFYLFRRRSMRRAQGSPFDYPFIGYGKNRNSIPSSIGFNPLAMVRQRSRRSIQTILSSFKRVRRKPVPVYREEDLTSVSNFSTDTYSSRVFSDDLTSSSPSFQEKMPIDHTYAMHLAGQDEKDVRESLVEIPVPLILAPVRSQHLQ